MTRRGPEADAAPPGGPFACGDYEAFLAYLRGAWLSPRRSQNAALGAVARRLGLKSHRGLGMVLSGQRLPSRTLQEKLAKHFRWSVFERSYVDLLCRKERDSRKGADTAGIDRELQALVPMATTERTFTEAEFLYIAEWYHLPLSLAAAMPGASEAPERLAKALRGKVTAAEAFYGLQRLLQLGVVEKAPDGKLALATPTQTSSDIPSLAIRRHHRGMIQRALESLEEDPPALREISSATLTMDPARLAEAKAHIRAFKESFRKEFFTPEGHAVFQLNVQFFAHTPLE